MSLELLFGLGATLISFSLLAFYLFTFVLLMASFFLAPAALYWNGLKEMYFERAAASTPKKKMRVRKVKTVLKEGGQHDQAIAV